MKQAVHSFLYASIAVLVSACSATEGLRTSPLPEDTQTDPSQLLIVTVPNELLAFPIGAGSTRHRYDGNASYGVSGTARATVNALERDYGLSEVAAWPIRTLHVHCVVFRVQPPRTLPRVISELMHDRRVQSVQVLNQFATEGKTP